MPPSVASLDHLRSIVNEAVAVVAHPDDESFGLGAIISGLTERGVRVRVVCFTHGEASTLGATTDMAALRRRELEAAAQVLGVEAVRLCDFADGGLPEVPVSLLVAEIDQVLASADLLVAFEPGGVTGHADHQAATAAARRAAAHHGLAQLEWGLPPEVATRLSLEFGGAFTSVDGMDVKVDRANQWRAIRCHASQASDNPVLRRRLELLGDSERLIYRSAEGDSDDGTFVSSRAVGHGR